MHGTTVKINKNSRPHWQLNPRKLSHYGD